MILYAHIAGWICVALSLINTFYAVAKNRGKFLLVAAVLLAAAWISLSL